MEGRLLLKNCAVFRADGRVRAGMAVVVEEGRIRRVAPDAEVPVLPGDWEVACRGRLRRPGPGGLPRAPGERAAPAAHRGASCCAAPPPGWSAGRGWRRCSRPRTWRPSRASPPPARCASGVTSWSSTSRCPRTWPAALAAQARAAEAAGLRLVPSHSTHSLDGAAVAEARLEANADFARSHRNHPLVRGALGFHASYTCEDALLKRLSTRCARSPARPSSSTSPRARRTSRHLCPLRPARGAAAGGARAAGAARHRRLRALGGPRRGGAPRADGHLRGPRAPCAPHRRARGEALETHAPRHHLVGLGTGGHGTLADECSPRWWASLQPRRAGRLSRTRTARWRSCSSTAPRSCAPGSSACPRAAVEEGRIADLVVYDDVPTADPESGYSPQPPRRSSRAAAWRGRGQRPRHRARGAAARPDFVELAHAASEALASVWDRAR